MSAHKVSDEMEGTLNKPWMHKPKITNYCSSVVDGLNVNNIQMAHEQ